MDARRIGGLIMDKNRLLTKQEFKELQPSMSGVETIVLKAQDRKSVKAIIEEIEFQKYELCDVETYETGRSICLLQQDDDCNNPCRFMSENCRWWQQFKERNGIK